jgi:hypothetical protein
MSDQQQPPPFNQNAINVSGGQLQAKIVAQGSHNKNINVDKIEVKVDGNDLLPLLKELLDFKRQFEQAGFKADIAAPALPTAQVASVVGGIDGKERTAHQPADPSASLHGMRLSNIPVQAEQIDRLAQNAPVLDQLFHKIDVLAGPDAQAVQEIEVQGQHIKLVDLALQRGNLALWRFRRANARLFGQQITALFLAQTEWPAPPELQALTQQARANLDVLRGLLLVQFVAPQRPDLVMPVLHQLEQGRWRQVLDDWAARKVYDDESVHGTRIQLESLGERYQPEEVRATAREADANFAEALRRDPGNTAAMVNLGIIKAESALFFYIETGQADRATLEQAHNLFRQARGLLQQRNDQASRVALAKCLLYKATALPPQAKLEAVQWAALQAHLIRASLSQQAQRTINWDVAQRNFARREPSFFQVERIQQARDLFQQAGETTFAEECVQMLQGIEQAKNMLPQQVPMMQAAAPIVGTWQYQGQSRMAKANGMLVFDAQGVTHWLANAQSMMGAQRVICLGNYQVMGNMIVVQGQRWAMPMQLGATPPAMPMPFVDRIMIQQNNGVQLVLLSQEDGLQLFCQRV